MFDNIFIYNKQLEQQKNKLFLDTKKPNKLMLDFWLLLINFDICLNFYKKILCKT
jgi:hypothetical protein